MYRSLLVATIASIVLGLAGSAWAAPTESEPTTDQVAQEASQGQDTITAEEITKYIDQHQDLVSSILKLYTNYIKQIQTLSDQADGSNPAAAQTVSAELNTALGSGSNSISNTSTSASPAAQEGVMQPSSGLQEGSIQVSSGVQAGSVQPSSGLTTGHLAGYPSLPAVDPVSSVKKLSESQIEYAAKVRKENQDRKESLMAAPAISGN